VLSQVSSNACLRRASTRYGLGTVAPIDILGDAYCVFGNTESRETGCLLGDSSAPPAFGDRQRRLPEASKPMNAP
jgi:hypothetical protein